MPVDAAAVPPPEQGRPVFVDDSGRRHRRTGRAGWISATLLLAYPAALLVAATVTGGSLGPLGSLHEPHQNAGSGLLARPGSPDALPAAPAAGLPGASAWQRLSPAAAAQRAAAGATTASTAAGGAATAAATPLSRPAAAAPTSAAAAPPPGSVAAVHRNTTGPGRTRSAP